MSLKTDTFDAQDRPRAAGSLTAGLVLLYAPDVGVPSVILLVDPELVMGREPPSGGVQLPFTSVSRAHARLTLSQGRWRVEDLDSRNGTFANGARIHEAVLANGDELRVGEVVFEFVDRDAERFVEGQDHQGAPSG